MMDFGPTEGRSRSVSLDSGNPEIRPPVPPTLPSFNTTIEKTKLLAPSTTTKAAAEFVTSEISKPNQPIRNFSADTLAMVLFSTPIAMTNDILMANADFKQALVARLIALPVNMVTSRPYGIYRDALFKLCKVNKDSSIISKSALDTFAMVSFSGSVYIGILTTTGIVTGNPFSASELGKAFGTIATLMTVIGRPYGWFRNQIRSRMFGLETQDS